MTTNLETHVLLALTRRALGRPEDRGMTMDELFESATSRARGPDRRARRARADADLVLSVLRRYGPILAGLADGKGRAAIEREQGRWEEVRDSARATLAHGGPIPILDLPRRRRA